MLDNQTNKKHVAAKLSCEWDIFLVRDTHIVKFDLDKEFVHYPFSDSVSSILCVKILGDTIQILMALGEAPRL